MIRFITRSGRLNKVLELSRRVPVISVISTRYISYGLVNRYSTSSTPKVLKASSFTLPNDVPKKEEEAISQEDIDDFNITKLIHGKTDMKIAITQRASDKLTSISTEDKNINTALRIIVESGGCHGFQYNLKLTDTIEELKNDKDLLIFKRQDDGNAQIILDESSLEILQDSKIDYTKELIGRSFKVVDSPYTSSACGCGSSFDFDFDKLQKKMEQNEK